MRTFLLSAFLFASHAYSQTSMERETVAPAGDSRFLLGSRGGFGHSFLFPYGNCVFAPSWEIGLSALFMAGDHVGISLDGLFSAEGARFRSGETEQDLDLSYIRMPLKLNILFRPAEKKLRPRLSLGPDLGLLLPENDFSGLNRTDIGLNVTAGFSHRILRGFRMQTELSYYQGLRDMDPGNSENDLNGQLRLEIGLMVGL